MKIVRRSQNVSAFSKIMVWKSNMVTASMRSTASAISARSAPVAVYGCTRVCEGAAERYGEC